MDESIEQNSSKGITKEYNHVNREKLWDSCTGKKNYKYKVFKDKKTYKDPITGQTLHFDQKSSQNKYHMKNKEGKKISSLWANHAPETDHIISLKEIHNRIKANPFLTDADFKEIANKDYNYRITSKQFNASKGEKSDLKIALDKNSQLSLKGRGRLIAEKLNAEIQLNAQVALKTTQNIGNEFFKGAKDSLCDSVVPLAVEGTKRIIDVMKGEEDFDEAVKNLTKTAKDVALVGGTKQIAIAALSSATAGNNTLLNGVLDKIGSKDANELITIGLIIKESTFQYLNGELDESGFIRQVQMYGLMLLSKKKIKGLLLSSLVPGLGAGKIAVEIIATTITSVACNAVMDVVNTIQHINDYKIKENQIKRIERAALKEMSDQRERLKKLMEQEYSYWDKEIETAFNMIISNACEEKCDFQGITEGLNKILNIFGKKAKFKNIEEYEAQLDKPLVLNLGGR